MAAVVTADATGTQTTTAAYITGRGRHYVLTVKGNQRGLFRRCKALPWAKLRATSAPDLGHGRRVRRTIKVARPSTAGLRRGEDELDGETLVAHALTKTSVGTIPLIE